MMLVWLLVFLLFHLGNADSETEPKNNSYVAVIVDFEVDCIQYNCLHTRKVFGYFWQPLKEATASFNSCVRLDVYYCKTNHQFRRCQSRNYWDMLCTVWEFCNSNEHCPNLETLACQCNSIGGNRYYFTFNPRNYNWLKILFIEGKENKVEESHIIAESPIFHAKNYPGWIVATGAVVSVALAKCIG
ncbi:uncharacterized protein LOC131929901 isoform X2 [Physella acuta]|uniref:uncharacterized protein LOC131929901 isoform X2 n=1 Tax=Physella acuta TaxID=109671 RepID=UPI0027DD85A5|nr:uncharacterized protein LOC131929901 isoform X2 [Physella acuta]